MSDLKFSSAVSDWCKKTETLQADIVHEALRLLVEESIKPKDEGGHMPVVRGNLRNSVAVSTLGPVKIDWTMKKRKFRDPTDQINHAIAGVEIGKPVWIGYRAPYAHKVEPDNGFLRLPAQRWTQIVDEAARNAKGGK